MGKPTLFGVVPDGKDFADMFNGQKMTRAEAVDMVETICKQAGILPPAGHELLGGPDGDKFREFVVNGVVDQIEKGVRPAGGAMIALLTFAICSAGMGIDPTKALLMAAADIGMRRAVGTQAMESGHFRLDRPGSESLN